MWTITLKRILRSGYLIFKRNGWLSTATITVIVLVLFVLGNLIFLGAVAGTALNAIEEKIDISVYFVPDAPEANILSVKREVEAFPAVEEVIYISREKALDTFRERHKENSLIAEALKELGENPLEASINIKARDPSQYAAISEFLQEKDYPIIDKINYFENQKVIDRLSSIIATVRKSGAFLAFILAFVAVAVAFNTIRLAIYTLREEIAIMRLVGATPWFIRGPFLVSGLMLGVIAAITATILFLPLTWIAAPKLALVVPQFNLFEYFFSNIIEFFAIMFVAGIALGTISSLIAMRRYLKI